VLQGVDAITGRVNGFLDVAPALGATAAAFNGFAGGFTFSPMLPNGMQNPFFGNSANLEGVSGNNFTVQNFIDGMTPFCINQVPQLPDPDRDVGSNCTELLNFVTQTVGVNTLFNVAYGGNDDVRNLVEDQDFDRNKPNNTFEYMSEASYTTFDSFAGALSRYEQEDPGDENANIGFRFRGGLGEGFNFSLNYYYHYDANPYVKLSWEDSSSGQRLTPFVTEAPEVDFSNPNGPTPTGNTVRTVRLCKDRNTANCQGNPDPVNNEEVYNPSPLTAIAGFDPETGQPIPSGVVPDAPARLVFTEKAQRIHSIGASFDTAIETGFLSDIVLRGEFVYDKDTRVPVVDRSQLGIGNVTVGLQPKKADFFKYVLGVDITVLTNLLVSTQFIQFINLDYEDSKRDSLSGQGCTIRNCGRYTADPATLSLTNGLNKGEEYDTFESLFLSKPFGPSQLGRFNNITIHEKGGGWWNRFDVEYQFTDEFIARVEWNQYWGDDDTTFGQLNNSSNLQVGLKYILE